MPSIVSLMPLVLRLRRARSEHGGGRYRPTPRVTMERGSSSNGVAMLDGGQLRTVMCPRLEGPPAFAPVRKERRYPGCGTFKCRDMWVEAVRLAPW